MLYNEYLNALLLSTCLRRCFRGSTLTHSFRGAFARGGFAFGGVPHMNPNTKSLHGGFWCCSSGPEAYSFHWRHVIQQSRSTCIKPLSCEFEALQAVLQISHICGHGIHALCERVLGIPGLLHVLRQLLQRTSFEFCAELKEMCKRDDGNLLMVLIYFNIL